MPVIFEPGQFWDDVTRRGLTDWMADNPASKFYELFAQVGPFDEDLSAAGRVLDVGPGFAQVLRGCFHADRFAI
jgi:hypothetical protein